MMKELITESRREYYYTRLYVDVELFKKQRMQNAVVFGLLGLFIGLIMVIFSSSRLLGVFIALFLSILGGYIGYKLKYKELLALAKQQDEKISLIFPEFLQVFIGMLEVDHNGGILKALKMSIPYVQNPVKSKVIRLTHSISNDGSINNVRESLYDFGQYVGTPDAIQVLDLVNDMYVDGVDVDILDSASDKVEELNKNTVEAYVEKKRGRLRMRSLPSLIYGLVFIFIYLGVVAIEYFLGAFL